LRKLLGAKGIEWAAAVAAPTDALTKRAVVHAAAPLRHRVQCRN
jgi:hypothetical protein